MTYESEQQEYQKELQRINATIVEFDRLFEQYPHLKEKGSFASFDRKRMQLEHILQYDYGYRETFNRSTQYLEYLLYKFKKAEVESKLKESRLQRNISKTISFVGDITPEHVSGRIYKVKDGDGCGKFCLWFLIIDAIIVFIYYLINGVH